MYSLLQTLRWSAAICLLLAVHGAMAGVSAQRLTSQDSTLIEVAREIIASARYCSLITVTSGGKAEARAMDPLAPDDKMVIWFSTNPLSQKVRDIRLNPKVTVYYFDAQAQGYVSIQGTARLVNDPKAKALHWKEEWSEFYPDREKGFMLIEVTPIRMEVVNVKREIVGDPKTWKPPFVDFTLNYKRP